jgi:hypothetical protein
MQIRNVILFGHHGKVRTLTLRLNQVNIITGKSRTGKTALLDIIDYCLGRTKCNVASGVIRDSVEWYALLLQFPAIQVFVARKNPGLDATTNHEIVYESARSVTVPTSADELTPNITEEGLKAAIGRLVGITPNESVPPESHTRLPLRATLDHAKFLIFQGQSEIADRETLFHRQKEQFIPQAIKDTLPYFLGAVPEDSLMQRAKLREAKQELAKLLRQKAENDHVAGQGNIRSNALLSEAREVGLLDPNSPNDARSQLESLAGVGMDASLIIPIFNFGEEAGRLRGELSQLRRRHQEWRDQIDAATVYNGAESSFKEEASSQQSRLEVVGILPPESAPSGKCPLCESTLSAPLPSTTDLNESLRRLREDLADVGANRPRVDEYVSQLQSMFQSIKQQISDVRMQLGAVESGDQRSRAGADLERRRSMVLGRISLYLETVPGTPPDQGLGNRISALEEEIAGIESQLDSEIIREAVDSALSRIGQWMTDGAHALELEYALPYRLDIGQLTVVADSESPVRMSQMGSAANWRGCHLISHLSLQRWFAMRRRPVPRFLFIDQPTSAYYPPDDPGTETDEDRIAVERMYKWLIEFVGSSKSKFQLIVVDHADITTNWFRECVVERWRGDKALIPAEWLAQP